MVVSKIITIFALRLLIKIEIMNLNYKLLRLRVKFLQNSKKRKFIKAMKPLMNQQIKAFNKVKELSKINNSTIRFDPKSDKIILVLPKMLITLKNDTIFAHNTNGFTYVKLTEDSFDILKGIVEMEAHRKIRKLEQEVNQRIDTLLDNIDTTEHDYFSEFESEENN